ncbi:MAG: ATP synthase F1 subunit delta [Christensenellales bacterium]|nr:ATP synthase F1 subunit delta [Christensenellales bacterium]
MTRIGSVYARALYDLAADEGLSREILDQMSILRDVFAQNPDYMRLLSTPNLSGEDRCKIVDDGFRGRVQPYVLNFIKLLTGKGYIRHFPDCCDAYREMYNGDHDILPVRAVAAIPMTEAQRARLCARLEALTGKHIELNCAVDPRCVGGVRLDYEGKRMDDTIRHRLDDMRSLLKNTVL